MRPAPSQISAAAAGTAASTSSVVGKEGASDWNTALGKNRDSTNVLIKLSRGRGTSPTRGRIASDDRMATRASRIRRAGCRHAIIASTMNVKNTAADKDASNRTIPVRSIQAHMAKVA